jgi:hypothetical protein
MCSILVFLCVWERERERRKVPLLIRSDTQLVLPLITANRSGLFPLLSVRFIFIRGCLNKSSNILKWLISSSSNLRRSVETSIRMYTYLNSNTRFSICYQSNNVCAYLFQFLTKMRTIDSKWTHIMKSSKSWMKRSDCKYWIRNRESEVS